MKCEHCGKNEVTFVYHSNYNGRVTEQHLCGECAEKLGLSQRLAAQSQRMMQSFFSDDLFGGFFSAPSLLGRMDRLLSEDPLDDFFAEMPALQAAPAKRQEEQSSRQEDLVDGESRSRFSALRQRNALKMELRQAVRQENFERAAELRDQLRALESELKNTEEGA